MSDQPSRSPRGGRRSRTALPIVATQTPEGTRLAYRRLGAQLDILSWTIEEPLFLEREQWVWTQLLELARARGIIEPDEPTELSEETNERRM